MQSLNQSMTFSSFEQNGWKWCNDKLIVVPVWLTGSQLPPAVIKRSHKVKVTKKDVYLSDDNLADDEENITEPKRKRKQILLILSASFESNNSSITKPNWTNTFGIKKRLIDKFCEGSYENENAEVRENNSSSDKESDREVSNILSSEDSCDEWLPSMKLNLSFRSSQQEVFHKISVQQKPVLECSFSARIVKKPEKYV